MGQIKNIKLHIVTDIKQYFEVPHTHTLRNGQAKVSESVEDPWANRIARSMYTSTSGVSRRHQQKHHSQRQRSRTRGRCSHIVGKWKGGQEITLTAWKDGGNEKSTMKVLPFTDEEDNVV